MKIASIKNGQNKSFKGSFLNSKKLLKVLKFASDKSALVTSGATVVFAAGVKPAVTMLTPNTPERDKKYAAAKSIASAIAAFAITGLISRKINKGVEKLAKNKDKYLTPETIENLKDGAQTLDKSDKYGALEQLVKLSPEALAVIPKLFLTSALITPIANCFVSKNKEDDKSKTNIKKEKQSFKGNSGARTAKIIAKVMNNEKVQKFAGKIKDKKFIEYAIYAKDIFATAVFSGFIKINKTIDQKDKTNLIANTAVSTACSIIGAMTLDKIFEKPLAKLSNQFKMANKGDMNLDKYLKGAKIIKSSIVLGLIYYGIVPLIATYTGSKIANNKK